ncbi:MAG: DNA-directed RNA polymerase subunit alpha [Candidatus Chisholmbacteria bacterium RIFCSPHIGHO2_01_FULL_48_12]|uniref:DNA-directed RNA polymerase subunit alpha n=1 Tax=Candidatus Chisholmbacteria bacterium RIFCSPHIGHO2_01_FULL_48_12 TaxID=1797589 RepID=A0A1G1VME6_9BACT|nr:MAG: DNA-directed RNA polymerase subunit alpha [Candidatus Chisholmbacteria bacterium RIFCSPHIGHO2_01_FULL_48_12]
MIQPKFTTILLKQEKNYAELVMEPLEQGYGHTLGNALRRVLLSSLPGAAVTSVKIGGIRHQFATLEGLEQDIVELILNLKQVRLHYEGAEPVTARIKMSGAGTIRAADIEVPATVQIVNPDLELAELTEARAKLEAELTIEGGTGYSMAEERQSTTIGVIPMDVLFSPVTRVAYKVEATRVGRRTDFDKLILQVWTDGTVEPQEAVNQAAQILVAHFKQVYDPVVIDQPQAVPVAVNGVVPELYRLTVEELDLPTRIANALRKGGYKTVKDLAEATVVQLKQVKNLGEKSVESVVALLAKKGIEINLGL